MKLHFWEELAMHGSLEFTTTDGLTAAWQLDYFPPIRIIHDFAVKSLVVTHDQGFVFLVELLVCWALPQGSLKN